MGNSFAAKRSLDDDEYLRALGRFEVRAMWAAGAIAVAVVLWIALG